MVNPCILCNCGSATWVLAYFLLAYFVFELCATCVFPEVIFAKFRPALWQWCWVNSGSYSSTVTCRWHLFLFMLIFCHTTLTTFSISTAELTKSAFHSDISKWGCNKVFCLSPELHSNGTHWPFLSLCPGLQWRQWSADEQMMQSAGQGSHRLLEEWKNPSGQTSRHWLWNRYLATPNLSRWSK